MNELKRCMRCGLVPRIIKCHVKPQNYTMDSDKIKFHVLCECGQGLFFATFHGGFTSEEKAIEAWNSRKL